MKWERLTDAVNKDETLFETSLLFAGADHPQQAQRQVADWARAGKVVQLRRGLYALAGPHRPMRPHPFVVANHLVPASYVSLQMALSYYSLIPEHVAIVTSVTTQRPGQWQTPYGRFAFHHLQTDFFYGFEYRAVSQTQSAFVALAEKALLDLIYLQPGGDKPEFLTSLRLQNLDRLDVDRLFELAQRLEKPKLQQAACFIADLVAEEAAIYQAL
jgi:predicted transcriptional regulator of viral defense system